MSFSSISSKPFLSIVIPVYNVDKYLNRCLDSCINQDISVSDYEIIAVNDGSTDSCEEILRDYAGKYRNFTFISQKNQGLSMARNNGLDIANGDFIWFIDSDDWIDDNCIGGIVGVLRKTDIDMFQIGYRLVYDDPTNNKNTIRGFFEGIHTGMDVIRKMPLPTPVQFTIFKHSFLKKNRLRFFPGIYHEDTEFKPRALFYANNYCSYNKVVYNYYQRNEGSIMAKFTTKRAEDLMIVANNLIEFKNDNCNKKRDQMVFDYCVALVYKQLLMGINKLSYEDKNKIISNIEFNRMSRCMLNSKKFTHRLEGLMFKFWKRMGLKLYSLR